MEFSTLWSESFWEDPLWLAGRMQASQEGAACCLLGWASCWHGSWLPSPPPQLHFSSASAVSGTLGFPGARRERGRVSMLLLALETPPAPALLLGTLVQRSCWKVCWWSQPGHVRPEGYQPGSHSLVSADSGFLPGQEGIISRWPLAGQLEGRVPSPW